MDEKRTSPRFCVSFPVECSLLSNRSYFYTVSKDLSLSGAKIFTDEFLSSGSSLKVNINLIDCVVDAKARVVWCNKERVSDRYIAGLQFVETIEQNKAVLSRFLNKINS